MVDFLSARTYLSDQFAYAVSPCVIPLLKSSWVARDIGELCSLEEEVIPAELEGDQEAEEEPKVLVPNVAVRPSIQEVDKHNATHLPFRSWCPYCVEQHGQAQW